MFSLANFKHFNKAHLIGVKIVAPWREPVGLSPFFMGIFL
jgi:hypothetical protein